MARHPQPRRITLGGREAVALTVEEYEALIASRRQIGGQSARVRVLGQQVRRTERLLQDLESLVAAPPDHCGERTGTTPTSAECLHADAAEMDAAEMEAVEPDAGPGCLRCAVAALLHRHRHHHRDIAS
ncbi:hypothetical protein [Streptomyces antibioticus]|uniref:hypothetical protein n=1 Tax=Streptomyces antibioticus TaxID=1890 RepID=UPI002253D953|nr:hypothetical protein [Streptomyces antibioticus]MCX4743800.1 hypothetical protein [Streptomyces antibioticus]